MSTINALKLDCNYAVRSSWGGIRADYSCLAKITLSGDERNVTEVTGVHQAERSNSDVILFMVENQLQLTVFPGNLIHFFPNVEKIVIINTSINRISRRDLQGMPGLRTFQITTGKLTEVRNDLFLDNPLLEVVIFQRHQIKHFGDRVFDPLPKLNELHLQWNPCISKYVMNRANVLNLIAEIRKTCPPSNEMVMFDILRNSPEFKEHVKREVSLQVDPVRKTLLETQKSVKMLDSRVETLEKKCINFNHPQTTTSISTTTTKNVCNVRCSLDQEFDVLAKKFSDQLRAFDKMSTTLEFMNKARAEFTETLLAIDETIRKQNKSSEDRFLELEKRIREASSRP